MDSRQQWKNMYNVAKKYYDKNGDLLVPSKYVSDDNIKLGYWITRQRKDYRANTLSKERIVLLEKIGMVWSIYDAQWIESYNAALEYYRDKGNLLVPLRYKTIDNRKLGLWISVQRKNYKLNKISSDRIEMLEQIGMVWDVIEFEWESMYEIAGQYFDENHNLSISSTTFTYQDVSLGSWVVTQRKNYSEGRLTDKQINLLNKIGMEWVYSNNPDYVWDKNYNKVLDFYNRYKHLYIPIGYVTEEGVRLGVWLYDRKYEYEHNELSEDRRKKLDKLDKTWRESVNTKSSFPEQAVLFYIKKVFPSAIKYTSEKIFLWIFKY